MPKMGGARGAGGRAGSLAGERSPVPPAAGKCLPIVLPPVMLSASEVALVLAEHWQCLEACCIFFFLWGWVFFCLSKAGNKACAIMVFESVSALHPQQWLLKFGRGYTSERYIHFCTFHDSK